MLEQSSQKRRFIRIPEHVPVQYRIRGRQESYHTITDDISILGAGIKAESYIPPSCALMLELNVSARIVRAVGRVSWIANLPHSNRTRFGVEFIECDPLDSEYLADFIESRVKSRKD